MKLACFATVLWIACPSAYAAQTSDVWRLLDGEFDTLMSFPKTHPVHYALSFEFADELGSRCNGLFSSDYQGRREISYNGYSAFLWYLDWAHKIHQNQTLGRRPADFLSEALGMAFRAPSELLPTLTARRTIDGGLLASATIDEAGGCGSERLRELATVLEAIGTFGTLPSPPSGVTEVLKMQKLTYEGRRLSCVYYSSQNNFTEKKQEYLYPTEANKSTYLSISGWVQNYLSHGDLNEFSRAMRFECPQTLDTEQGWISAALPPDDLTMDNKGATRAERIANYFINVYTPGEGLHQTRHELTATKEELEALRQEIIKLESIVLTDAEINEAYEAYALRDKSACLQGGDSRCNDLNYMSIRLTPKETFAGVMHFKRFKEIYGSMGVFEREAGLELSRKGIPQYVLARREIIKNIR